ncbi:MAG: FAD-dependent oxidoreductase [Anaerolineales bacterium]|nr:FAD-dependent oxidoreductase [Anaerolineales bacterium]
MKRVVVVGAGVGGLTTAALLARAGLQVTVLEAHIYPGGCAGTFYHQGYRFDAGATVAGGFYPAGPMDRVARLVGIQDWGAQPTNLAMAVHLPGGIQIMRWGDERRHAAMADAFGAQSLSFWRWQERSADALWAFALRSPAWPPQSLAQLASLLQDGLAWLGEDPNSRLNLSLLADAFRPAAHHLRSAPKAMRLFVDAQLLISAQTTSQFANALYAASALDLPRRGVVHLKGGMGAIADALVQAVRQHGGQVLFRQEATSVRVENGRIVGIETRRGDTYPADLVVFNLPPWNIARLLADQAPSRLRRLPDAPPRGWGAFMVYLGLDASALPADFPLHHQVILGDKMGEGSTVFLSLSPEWDPSRAPAGRRVVTISTHTDFKPWWSLYETDRAGYEARQARYTQRVLETASRAIPGIQEAADLILPGTPVTFRRFTHRLWGWVGGFPQVDLFQTWGPKLGVNYWMVGDSIFPGQSTAAVALGGMRLARDILSDLSLPAEVISRQPEPPTAPV